MTSQPATAACRAARSRIEPWWKRSASRSGGSLEVAQLAVGEVVDAVDLVAAGEQPERQVRADESGDARDRDLQTPHLLVASRRAADRLARGPRARPRVAASAERGDNTRAGCPRKRVARRPIVHDGGGRPAPVREGRPALARPAPPRPRSSSSTPASTTTPRCRAPSSTSWDCRRPTAISRSARARHGAMTGRMLEALERGDAGGPAGAGAGAGRHQLDPGRRPGRGQARPAGRARGGGPAQPRRAHAGGDQPPPDRPRLAAALLPDAGGGREPARARGSAPACTAWAT